jgi:hypothetical protein
VAPGGEKRAVHLPPSESIGRPVGAACGEPV